MATTEATAPGKVILFGEHAVVYGQPAIAAPVTQLRARAIVADSAGPEIWLIAPDLALRQTLTEAPADNPLAKTVRLVAEALGIDALPGLTVSVKSDLPIASGLGSGAAISAAVVRALATHLGHAEAATDEWVSALTYEVEKLHHGTPSGIDNTVVAYNRPVFFERRQPQNLIEPFIPRRTLHLLIGDTGIRSATRAVVGDVRRRWQAAPDRYERLFAACGRIARSARLAIEAGAVEELGDLMLANHRLLQEMTVSAPALDALVTAAVGAGAIGAKLSGAGRGGNMIALTGDGERVAVRRALLAAGAVAVISSSVEAAGDDSE